MVRREIVFAAAGTLAGVLVASAAWSLQKPAIHAKAEPSATPTGGDDVESLRTANAHLVESLADADRTIASLREQLASGPAPTRPEERGVPNEDAGRNGR